MRTLRLACVATAALAVTNLAGCGVLDGTSGDAPSESGPVEKSTIKVGRLSLVDAIPLHLAIDKNYFKDEGLTVELSTMGKGSESVDKLINGELHVGLSSYPGPIIAHAKDVAKFKVVADAVETTPDLILVVVKAGGPINDARKLAGRKVAVSSKRGISELVMSDQLISMGVDPRGVSFVPIPITDMPAALDRGDVAAAIMAQPSLEEATRSGAMKLLDPFTGQTAAYPWSGWFATEKFVGENPKTIAAFRRALSRGVADAADRTVLEESAGKNLNTNKDTARLMTVPRFPSTIDALRLQRVADLLAKHDEIPKVETPQGVRAVLDMHTMVLPPLSVSATSATTATTSN